MSEMFQGNESSPAHRGNIVVFDLDGTIADLDHRLHLIQSKPPDWDAFYKQCPDDKPIHPVRVLCNEMELICEVIILTARRQNEQLATRKWLKDNKVRYNQLTMLRPDGNKENDYVLKQRWLESFEDRDRIWFIVDDRDQVVKMWRENGITCLQPRQGDY